MKTVIGIVVLGVIVGGIYVLNDITRSSDGKSLLHVARETEIQVQTARPEHGEIVRCVQAPGEVEAFAEVDISSEVVSKILEMPIEEGDYVRKGELLCRLDDADYRARVLSRQANVAKLKALITQAQADLDKAQRDWEQQQRLRETNATSALELANYKTALITAGALLEVREQELLEAEAGLQSAREDLAKTVIQAPISGVVSQLFAKQGEVVVTGTMNNPGTRIMVVSDLSKMQVRCRVDEADATLAAPDQTARIYLQSDTRRSIPGWVHRVGTQGTKPLGRDVVTFETLVLIAPEGQEVGKWEGGKVGTEEDGETAEGAGGNVGTEEEGEAAEGAGGKMQAAVVDAAASGEGDSAGPPTPTSAPAPSSTSLPTFPPSHLPSLSAYSRVKPGMTANVEIEVARREDTITIPIQAVVYRKRRDLPAELLEQHDRQQAAENPGSRQNIAEYIQLVFCVEDGKAHPRLVRVGINDATRVEILEGVTLADTIVIGPYRSLDQLKDGSPVKLEEEKKPGDTEEETTDDGEDAPTTAPAESTEDADGESQGESDQTETSQSTADQG